MPLKRNLNMLLLRENIHGCSDESHAREIIGKMPFTKVM
jgi:hypothetical protein